VRDLDRQMDIGTEWSGCGQHHQSLVAVADIRKNNSIMIMEVQRLGNGYEVRRCLAMILAGLGRAWQMGLQRDVLTRRSTDRYP
jgi:hypothetical protein